VTGFKFQGRRGTAIVDGVVIAAEFGDAMKETILSLRWQVEREEQEKRGKEAIKWWKKFMVGLRVRERIMGYEIEGEKESDIRIDKEVHEKMEEIEDEEERGHNLEQGGFLPDFDQGPSAQPTAGNQDEPDVFDSGDIGINDFDALVTAPRIDDKLIVTPSPWDKGGALHHLNPHKVSSQRKKPQLPRTHTPGLFLSPTRPDDEIEEGGGFFGDGDVDHDQGRGFLPEHDGNGDVMEGGGFEVDASDEVMLQSRLPPGIRTYDSLFEEPNEGEQVSNPEHTYRIKPPADGGGFTVEDDVGETEKEGIESDVGGGFIIEDNNTALDTQISNTTQPDRAVEASKEAGTVTGDGHTNPDPKANDTGAEADEDAFEADSELLSHDEDDEDAEPEWLVDEIGW